MGRKPLEFVSELGAVVRVTRQDRQGAVNLLGEQRPGQPLAEEAGSAGNQDVRGHGSSFEWRGLYHGTCGRSRMREPALPESSA